MAKDNIRITVSAKDLASATLGRVKTSTVALGTAIGNLASRMAVGAMNGIRSWINEALEAERANVMLDAALRGTGNYSEETARKMQALANAIQDETGASDEAVKSNIAMLLTMGTAPYKMADAARAVQALSALNFEGAQATKAVALAMEGNMLGFARMVPAIRNCKTEEEKAVAVNELLAAGYAQQKANLQTVGGAWAALKGRIGDAREDIVGAVLDGLKLGRSFDDAQAAVGRFLKSDTFTSFTEKIRDGADYVRQIVNAMDTAGGTKEVASAMGGVILAALKDGADYVGMKISGAFGNTKAGKVSEFIESESVRGKAERKAFKESSFWEKMGFAGTRKSMAAGEAAVQKYFQDKYASGNKGGGNLDRALAKLEKIVNTRAGLHNNTPPKTPPAAQENNPSTSDPAPQIDIGAARKRDLEEAEKIANTDELRARHIANIASIEADIEAAAYREREARDKLAKLQEQRRNAAEQNVNQWIGELQGRRRESEQNQKDFEKASRRADTLQRKTASGAKLSKRDAEWLEDFQRNAALRKPGRVQRAADAANAAKKARVEMERRLAQVQEDQLTEMKTLNRNIKQSLEVG